LALSKCDVVGNEFIGVNVECPSTPFRLVMPETFNQKRTLAVTVSFQRSFFNAAV
jgi:hypothetical protein